MTAVDGCDPAIVWHRYLTHLNRRGAHLPSLASLIAAISVLATPAKAIAQENVSAGSVVGAVWDSTRGGPLVDAEIILLNTTVRSQTNSDGRFFIPNLLAGKYLVTFAHPRLDSLRFTPTPFTIFVTPAGTTQVELGVPQAASAELNAKEVNDVAALLQGLGVRVNPDVQSRIRGGRGATSDLYGLVVENASNRPIAGAHVALEGASRTGLTDAEGRFTFKDVPARTYALKVTMLGFSERRDPLEVAPGQRLDVRVDLVPRAIALPALVVEARSRALDRAGFYERKKDRGTWGRFFTSTDLERKNLLDVSDLFNSIPGARVISAGFGKKRVVFTRTDASKGQGCAPPVYVDGMRINDALEYLSPAWIEGLEVYAGNNTPIEYASFNPCGVILVWTKR